MRRTRLVGRGFQAIAVAVVVFLLGAGVAFADFVENDVVVGGNDTITAGGSTTINYSIRNQNIVHGDTQNNCNPADGTAATVNLTVPNDVTASRTSFTLADCGISAAVTFSSSKPGNYTISVASVTDSGGGVYNTAGATWSLKVNAPPNTAPSVSVTGVTNGQTYEKSSVPQPGCSVTDAEDTNESATPQITNGAYNDLGSHTVTCTYTDGGGITRSASATYTVIRDPDTTPPVIGYTLNPASPPTGSNGWYRSNVTLTWSVTENESPETLGKTGCVDQNITSDQQETTYSCSATSEGGTAGQVDVKIKRDATAPTNVSGSPDRAPDSNGWYNSSVGFTFTGDDATSGIAGCSTASYSGPDGQNKTVSGKCTDNAGNDSAAVNSSAIDYDATRPTSGVTGVSNGAVYTIGAVPQAGCNTLDNLSGVATQATLEVVSGSGSVGDFTVKCTGGTDNAGNAALQSASVSFKVVYNFSGFFQPIDNNLPNSAKAGQAIPVKWRLTDANGVGISDPASFVNVVSNTTSGACSGTPDALEEYAGSSGLQYLGDGYWQFNWKTPKNYVGQCRTMKLLLSDNVQTRTAGFVFK
jgi:hypothetical protein